MCIRDSVWAAGGADAAVLVWDSRAPEAEAKFSLKGGARRAFSVAADGHIVWVGDYSTTVK
eukprot:8342966-Pyramimonas_sp.AAC.1